MAEWGVMQERSRDDVTYATAIPGLHNVRYWFRIACVMAHLSTARVCDPNLTQDLLETYTSLQPGKAANELRRSKKNAAGRGFAGRHLILRRSDPGIALAFSPQVKLTDFSRKSTNTRTLADRFRRSG